MDKKIYKMKLTKVLCGFLFFISYNSIVAQNITIDKKNPIDFVNPLIGTDSNYSLSNGNVYPAIALPWGMNFWTPQTGEMGSGWAYTYDATQIKGFKQTHQPSPWMNDYGQFSIMPVSDSLRFTEKSRQSWFSHKSETVKPNYYKVFLADHNVTTEITPTERAARFRFTFNKTDSAFVVIDAFDKGSYIKIIPEENKLIGYTTKNSGGVPENFKNFFIIEFEQPINSASTFNGENLQKGIELKADHAGAVINFKTKGRDDVIEAKVASSFISFEQAERNLQQEINSKSFEELKNEGAKIWNEELKKVEVSGGTVDQMTTFYSCLYRTLLFPRKFYEYDENGEVVHYSPYNGEVLPGYMFTDTGFWDTFRSLFPFLNLMYPELSGKMQKGLVNAYKESGWLPEWASPGLRNIMIGNNSASVVADAYLEIGDKESYDIEILYEALLHGANNEGPLTAVGRAGVEDYNNLGYVSYDGKVRQNVSRTLEYAYNDFSIYQVAKALNRPKREIELYKKRSFNYKNVYDPETKFMRGKLANGEFVEDFDPIEWGEGFTEGSSMHYTWSVFHDIEGLKNLMGGRKEFIHQLDTVFSSASTIRPRKNGSIIHEMREMQVADMGQYAHGNQPIQHMTYLYNYAGEPWKSQFWVRETLDRMYLPTPDGYCGDEDNGQTSAWYVFSALGFYPVTPAVNQYVMGAPLFKKAILHLENGNKITINAPENSSENKYINELKIDGTSYSKNFLKYEDLIKGAKLDFEMVSEPNKKRGVKKSDAPYSLSNQ